MIANEPSRLGDQTQIAVCGAQRQHVVAGAILARRGSVSGGDMPSKCLSRSHAPREARGLEFGSFFARFWPIRARHSAEVATGRWNLGGLPWCRSEAL